MILKPQTTTRVLLNGAIIPIITNRTHGNVLDIGALNSPYQKYMNYETYTTLDVVKKNKPDIVADIHKTNLPSTKFDTIIATEVLEHLYNPHKAVNEMHRILKPNGCVIASTRFIYPLHGEPYDYFRFTKYGLLSIFSKFDKTEIISMGNSMTTVSDIFTVSHKLLIPLRFFINLLLPTIKLNTNSKSPNGYVVIAEK